jgi:molybdate/tungstate transport system substrate-binding protein
MSLIRPSRRQLLLQSAGLALGFGVARFPAVLSAQEQQPLEVGCAGSMRAMLDGAVKSAAAQELHLDLHAHAQGADAVAQAIVSGKLQADVFVPITATPMWTVLKAGKADKAVPIARTEMVLVYSPKSRYAEQFAAAAHGNAKWWEIMQQPGIRINRSDPRGDPGGRNMIFLMKLAEAVYGQPGLTDKVLGAPLNPDQVDPSRNAQELLASGGLDVIASYRTAAVGGKLPYITLLPEVNLGGLHVHAEHPEVSLTIEGKTFYPDPLVFYAATLTGAANAAGANAFLEWLRGDSAQRLFKSNGFTAPDDAEILTV